jgi:hypothetical protein
MIPNLPDLIIYFVLMPDCFTLSKTGWFHLYDTPNREK